MMMFAKLKAVLSTVLALALLVGGLGTVTLPACLAEGDTAKPVQASAAQPARNQPGPQLNDQEFLRRVSLDLRGVPPTEVENRYFVADTEPKKRTRVVEWMLLDLNDVKNLTAAPGGNDSVWLDLGFPGQVAPDGRMYQPLIAPYVVDLDNRLQTVTWARLFSANRNVLPEADFTPDVTSPNRTFVDWQADPRRAWVEFYQGFPRYRATNKATWYFSATATSDEDFLRRACQEARGGAPTTVEQEYFKADKDPKKREKLLDLLLKDPAVAKKLGEGWKRKLLQPTQEFIVEQPLFWKYQVNTQVPLQYGYRVWVGEQPQGRLDRLLGQLLDGKRTDEQVLEGLSLALLGRLPTESERKLVLANVAKQKEKRAAWQEVLKTLAGTSEAKQHAEELKRRGAPEKQK